MKKAYNPPYIKIYGYTATEEQHEILLRVCKRRNAKGSISDWFRLIASTAVIWIWRYKKLPDVVYMDLTKEQRNKIKRISKEKGYVTDNDCISDILKTCIDNL